MSKVVRIRGGYGEVEPPQNVTTQRWDFLAKIGITDRLAHWMLDRLSEPQWSSLMTEFANYRSTSTGREPQRLSAKQAANVRRCTANAFAALRGGKKATAKGKPVTPTAFAVVTLPKGGR